VIGQVHTRLVTRELFSSKRNRREKCLSQEGKRGRPVKKDQPAVWKGGRNESAPYSRFDRKMVEEERKRADKVKSYLQSANIDFCSKEKTELGIGREKKIKPERKTERVSVRSTSE